MFRRIIVPCLVVALVATLAVVASVRTTPNEAEARVASFEMNYLCLSQYTNMYRGVFSPNCQAHEQLLTLPDDYPITLCSSTYDNWLRSTLATTGQCPMPNSQRFDLPDDLPVEVCYYIWTGLLRPSVNGACPGMAPSRLVSFPSGVTANDDTYQTLGNVDIDVQVDSGVLVNDDGSGLTVTSFQNPSANGGEVNVNPDGSFTYIPPMPDPQAFTGNDTFTYEFEDGSGSTAVGTVTIEILSPAVWFVNADAVDPGDGRRQTPLADIQELNGDPDRDEPGDYIFLFEAQNLYQPGITLEDGQTILGQDVDLAEILEQTQSTTGSSLLGSDSLPPFIVLPETEPSAGTSVLSDAAGPDGPALRMANDTTAVGFVVATLDNDAVVANGALDVLIDRILIDAGPGNGTGGNAGVDADTSTLLIVDSVVEGGDTFPTDGEGGTGLRCSSSTCDVVRSEIYGGGTLDVITGDPPELLGNAGGSPVADGGDAILAIQSAVTVTDSIVTGGDGGSEFLAGAGGFSSSLQGGAGGGIVVGGDGGDGIHGDGSEVTVSGSNVDGGHGGPGDSAGDGGDGIHNEGSGANGASSLAGLAGTLNPSIDVSDSDVTGGNGGDSTTDQGGFAGDGIFGVAVGVSVSDDSAVLGGNSGTNGGSTSFGAFAGDGIDWRVGSLALASEASSRLQGAFGTDPIISVIDSIIAGGQGGNSVSPAANGGGGGVGIFPDNYAVIDSSARMLYVENSTIHGGDGGANGTVFFTSGGGGTGISVTSSGIPLAAASPSLQGTLTTANVEMIDSTVTAGDGGANGGSGGNGAIFEGGSRFVVSNTTITAGNGQDAATNTDGGNGGPGVTLPHGGDLVIEGGSIISGGSGGDGTTGNDGSDGQSILYSTIGPAGSFNIDLQNSTYNNEIEVAQSSAGSVCFNAAGNTINGAISLVRTNGTLGITQDDIQSLEDDNSGVTVNTVGTITFGCGAAAPVSGGR